MVMGSHNIDKIDEHVLWLYEKYQPNGFGINLAHYRGGVVTEKIPVGKIVHAYTRLFYLSLEKKIYIDQISRRIKPFIEGIPRLKDCNACGHKKVYIPGGRWKNCINNPSSNPPLNMWSKRLPVFTQSCHGCIGIGHCGGGCIFDAESTDGPGHFDERYCSVIKSLTLTILKYFSSQRTLCSTNRKGLKQMFNHLLYTKENTPHISTRNSL